MSLLFTWAANAPEQAKNAKDNAQVVIAGTRSDVGDRPGLASPVGSILQERAENGEDYGDRTQHLNSSVGGVGQRAFVIVCPADRVRTNIETYVKDRDTGRVAMQWCIASKERGERRRGLQM